MVARRARLLALGAALVMGCSTVWGFDELTAGSGGAGTTGGSTASGTSGTGPGSAVEACQRLCTASCDRCGSTCTDLDSDPRNCGSCGTACAGGRVCRAGTCECPEGFELCPNQSGTLVCVNLRSDAAHCGACKAACEMDGLCVDSECGYPQDLATAQGDVSAIAVDSERVYYATGAEIRSVPLAGGDPTPLAAPGATSELVLDGDNLYYADDSGRLLRVSIDGGDPVELAAITPPVSLAVYEGIVYFIEAFAVKSLPAQGGEPSVLATATARPAPGIVVDRDGIYVTFSLDFYRLSHDGSSKTRVASRNSWESADVYDFVVGGDTIYYSSVGGSLFHAAIGSTHPSGTLAQGTIRRIVLDADELIYANGDGIHALSTAKGAAPRLLSSDYPSSLAADATHVYWTARDRAVSAGKVRRIPR